MAYRHRPRPYLYISDIAPFSLPDGTDILYRFPFDDAPTVIATVKGDALYDDYFKAPCEDLNDLLRRNAIAEYAVYTRYECKLLVALPTGARMTLGELILRQQAANARKNHDDRDGDRTFDEGREMLRLPPPRAARRKSTAAVTDPMLLQFLTDALRWNEAGFSRAAEKLLGHARIGRNHAVLCAAEGDVLGDFGDFIITAFSPQDALELYDENPAAANIRVAASRRGQILWVGYNTDRTGDGIARIMKALRPGRPKPAPAP